MHKKLFVLYCLSLFILIAAQGIASAPGTNSSVPADTAHPIVKNTPDTALGADFDTLESDSSEDTTAPVPQTIDTTRHVFPGQKSIDTVFHAETPETTAADTSHHVPPPDTITVHREEKTRPRPFRYPGISEEQDRLARSMSERVFSFAWDDAERIAKKMRKLETRDSLPPLSLLLMVAERVIRIEHNEFPDNKMEDTLLAEIDKYSHLGVDLASRTRFSDSAATTNLLIAGGIKGLDATIELQRNIVQAAFNGLKAVRMLNRSVTLNPGITDAYLGLGIFYCALAKAPPVVREALHITGPITSLDKGLDCLRTCASRGHYTTGIAKLYLLEFLNPYLGNLAQEKETLFKSLQHEFPHNPMYVFLELDERLCFNPGLFLK